MRPYLKDMLMEDITETLNNFDNLLDRAFEEGQLAAYVEFAKPHHDSDINNKASDRTQSWQAGFKAGMLQAYNENPQFGTLADAGFDSDKISMPEPTSISFDYVETKEGNVPWEDDDPQIKNKA